MSLDEILVSVFGAFLGYWIISNLITNSQNASNQKNKQPFINPLLSPTVSVATNAYTASISSEWFITLGVEESASNADIQSAYHKLIEMYHPDKVAHLGESLQQLAHQKTFEINEAYRAVQTLRGIEF